MKGIMKFGKKRKLALDNMSYEIVRRISQVAYELALPQELSTFRLVFHVLMLRKYLRDPSCIDFNEDVQVIEDLTY